MIKSADIVLFVTDTETFDCEDLSLLNKLDGKTVIKVYNKCDLNNFSSNDYDAVYISCKTKENLTSLKNKLFELGAKNINTDGEYITQKRHYFALTEAISALSSAINAIDFVPLDLICADIKECWLKLGEITGTTASEDIINEIFARFCVGK